MGLGRGWLKMPFCDDQGLQGPGLHQAVGAASKGVGEDTQSVRWPKYLCGTPWRWLSMSWCWQPVLKES